MEAETHAKQRPYVSEALALAYGHHMHTAHTVNCIAIVIKHAAHPIDENWQKKAVHTHAARTHTHTASNQKSEEFASKVTPICSSGERQGAAKLCQCGDKSAKNAVDERTVVFLHTDDFPETSITFYYIFLSIQKSKIGWLSAMRYAQKSTKLPKSNMSDLRSFRLYSYGINHDSYYLDKKLSTILCFKYYARTTHARHILDRARGSL